MMKSLPLWALKKQREIEIKRCRVNKFRPGDIVMVKFFKHAVTIFDDPGVVCKCERCIDDNDFEKRDPPFNLYGVCFKEHGSISWFPESILTMVKRSVE